MHLLTSSLAGEFDLLHLDTSDRRDLANTGTLDWQNVVLALQHFARFLTLLIRQRPQVVYVPVSQNRLGFLRDCLFLVPARLLRKRIVVHVHGGYFGVFFEESGPMLRALIRWVFAGVTRSIVLGDVLRPMMRGITSEARIAVVPNGTGDPGADEPDGRVHALRPRVTYVGTLTRTKGFLDALEAARLLLADGVDAEFVFAGAFQHASDEADARRLLDEETTSRITLPGVLAAPQRDALLRSSDIFVFPTYYPYEGHPYVILEAMAAGLPIITTAHAAIPETVQEGENAFMVEPMQPRLLADRIRQLLDDDAMRSRFGQASRTRYEEMFTLERWSERMAGVFRAALAD